MTDIGDRAPSRNLLLIGLLVIVTLFTAFHEGYLRLISALFWVSLVISFAISAWLALTVSTQRLLSLILGIFMIEYVKETIGLRTGLWTYHGINGQYNLGVWAWVLGGVVTFTLATKVAIKLVRRMNRPMPSWLNPVILALISLLIPLTLGKYREGTNLLFWSFYALLLVAGLYSSMKMDFSVFAGLIITAWIVGNPSEYLGSVSSKVWTFNHNPNYPPFFLLFGCWPLEILAQYSLSGFLANEALNDNT